MQQSDIVRAIEQNRLFLNIQPVVSTQTHRPVFYEALLRLRTDDGVIVPAADFIEIAEQQNYVYDIDEHALRLAIGLLERHRAFDLAINISSLTTADFAWVRMLDELTTERRQLTRRLLVEITETAAIADMSRTLLFVDALRDFGCRVSVDDFGAGHTNFTNLTLLAPNIVKIDRSYVANYENANARSFIEAVVELGQTLHFETVAEGVETEQCAQAVTDLGVTYLQGFLFGEAQEPDVALAPALVNSDQDRS